MMENFIVINTDGACRGNQNSENIGAWAYTIEHRGEISEGSGTAINTTNNQMELTAVIEALRAVTDRHQTVIIRTDSRYVQKGIVEWMYGWKIRGWKKANGDTIENQYLWESLDAQYSRFVRSPIVEHVKGHSGDEGNEKVDALCNKAMDTLTDSKFVNLETIDEDIDFPVEIFTLTTPTVEEPVAVVEEPVVEEVAIEEVKEEIQPEPVVVEETTKKKK